MFCTVNESADVVFRRLLRAEAARHRLRLINTLGLYPPARYYPPTATPRPCCLRLGPVIHSPALPSTPWPCCVRPALSSLLALSFTPRRCRLRSGAVVYAPELSSTPWPCRLRPGRVGYAWLLSVAYAPALSSPPWPCRLHPVLLSSVVYAASLSSTPWPCCLRPGAVVNAPTPWPCRLLPGPVIYALALSSTPRRRHLCPCHMHCTLSLTHQVPPKSDWACARCSCVFLR